MTHTMQTRLTIWQTIRLLLSHRRLADRRAFDYESNRFAKVMVGIASLFIVGYLIMLAVLFALIANDMRSMTSVELMCALLPAVMCIDFLMRLAVQQTPSQIARPYMLLPLPRHACVDAFIFSSLTSWGNLTWLILVIPYSIMSVAFSYGMLTMVYLVIVTLLAAVANSQWYSLTRTLANRSFLWWLLPVGFYALEASPLYLCHDAGLQQYLRVYSLPGDAIGGHSMWPLLAMMALTAILVLANRHVQYAAVCMETMGSSKPKSLKHVIRFSFLERYGELGTFLQLEIKQLMRNRNPRKAIIMSIVFTIILSMLIITTDIYDSDVMTNFLALYIFILPGATILVKVMGYEGNYVDLLFVRRENILALLHAKYIFYSAMLLLPFVLMQPMVIAGKMPLMMLASYAVYTMGFQYFVIFQSAVYTHQTIPMNEKITSKGGLDGNYVQMIITGVVFIIPNIIVTTLQTMFSPETTYGIMLAIGLAFVLTNRLWLRNIYNRMMKRKYNNLEGFTSTR